MPPARCVRFVPVVVAAATPFAARAEQPSEPTAPHNAPVSSGAYVSSEPLTTDRPDSTETPDAVDTGRAQLETGYTFSFREDVQTHTLPEALLRIGLLTDFELRIAWTGWVWERPGGGVATIDGPADLSLGFKVHLFDQDGLVPSLGVIGQTSIPVGDPPSGEDDFVPEGKLAWSYALFEPLTLSGNLSLAAAIADSGDRYAQFGASVSLGVGLTDRLGMYVEYFGVYGVSDATPEHSVNTGLTFLITNDLQLDARIGAGLSDAADDLFAGFGLSVRF